MNSTEVLSELPADGNDMAEATRLRVIYSLEKWTCRSKGQRVFFFESRLVHHANSVTCVTEESPPTQ